MNFFWAAVYSGYKLLGHDLPTGAIVTLRFGLAGLILLIAWPWLPGSTPKGRDLLITCALGLVVFVVGQRLQVYGNQIGSAGNSAVLMAVEPLLTSLAAAVFLREHIGPRRVAGFVLGIFGVALLNGVGRADFQWAGLSASLIFISSFVCETVYSVAGKPVVIRASPIKMVALSLLVGTAGNLLIDGRDTFAKAQALTLNAWLMIVFMAVVCTAVGYSLWFIVIRNCPVNVAALTIFTQAIFGVLIAAVWVHEKPHWGQLWGSLAILAGLIVGLSRQIKPRPATET